MTASLRRLHATLALSVLGHHRFHRSMIALSMLVPLRQPPSPLARSTLVLFVLAQSMPHLLRLPPSMVALSMKVPLRLDASMPVLSTVVLLSPAQPKLALSIVVSLSLVLSTLALSMKVLLHLAPSV
ncbi:unnamed protein product [Gadus morhua 'NCC']